MNNEKRRKRTEWKGRLEQEPGSWEEWKGELGIELMGEAEICTVVDGGRKDGWLR